MASLGHNELNQMHWKLFHAMSMLLFFSSKCASNLQSARSGQILSHSWKRGNLSMKPAKAKTGKGQRNSEENKSYIVVITTAASGLAPS